MGIKLYGVPENSEMGVLIARIEEKAKKAGFSLCRWQTNGRWSGGRWIRITYAFVYGERPVYSKDASTVMPRVTLMTREGATSRCRAYLGLSWLEAEMDRIINDNGFEITEVA